LAVRSNTSTSAPLRLGVFALTVVSECIGG
jgi:hypothetical protein